MIFFKSIIATVASIALTAVTVQAACTGTMRTRREWSQMSSSQQTDYIEAVKLLISRPSNGGNANSPETMSFNDFVQLHTSAAYFVHATAQFYPFHRAMVWAWERALRSTSSRYSDITVPYWEWSLDSQDFQRASVFNPNTFGTTGTLERPCLPDGFQREGQFFAASFPDIYDRFDCNGPRCCLRRVMQPGGLHDPTLITNNLNGAATYNDFRGVSEDVWHSTVHFLAGGNVDGRGVVGDMSHGAYSPNDILFYLHHATIDKIWYKWQKTCPTLRTFNYGGTREPRTNDNAANIDDTLFGFGNLRVRDVMDSDDLCYTYSTTAADIRLNAVDNCDPNVTPTAPVSPTSTTDNTASTAVPTANAFEAVWMQSVLRFLVGSSVSFQPPSFLIRRDLDANITEYGYGAPAVTEVAAPSYTNAGTDVVPPALPASTLRASATSDYADAPGETLPSTTVAYIASTTAIITPTLPSTTVAYTASTTAMITPTPTKGGFFIDEVYAPEKVTIGGQDIEIPPGFKIFYMDANVVKIVIRDFWVNKTNADCNYKKYRPIALTLNASLRPMCLPTPSVHRLPRLTQPPCHTLLCRVRSISR
ncbi:hypothetical protein BC829DRAFT_230186 [Chytridium lagenaria]|nr:hypothetical protein BC829DRAFT_230186 [Chytridium lagenaria]